MLELEVHDLGKKQLTPMLLVDNANYIVWRNQWAEWLFQLSSDNYHLMQLPVGDVLAGYADKFRIDNGPSLFSVNINGLIMDVEASMIKKRDLISLKFHAVSLSRASMLEMHKFMQDFALEAGDRVNNPLTTVLNCLHMIRRDIENEDFSNISLYTELAIREAFVMKEFGDWVRRLSEEPPSLGAFDLVAVLKEIMERRACEEVLQVKGEIPLVRGCPEHARTVLGGLVNLIRQANVDGRFSVVVCHRFSQLVTVEINALESRVKDLRMLTEEFYGGLGLLAARYLLSLMQAQIEMEYLGDVGMRITFLQANSQGQKLNAG
jgi:hypothetical protein